MATLNLRGVDDALVLEVKAAALRQGVTLVAFVSGVLAASVGESVERQRAPAPARVEQRLVSHVLEEEPARRVLTAELLNGRPAHDAKTCRVYKCGLCATLRPAGD